LAVSTFSTIREPLDLPSQTEENINLHRGRSRSAEEMAKGMHQRIGILPVQEMNCFKGFAQLGKQ
jgi:hypothetical protein